MRLSSLGSVSLYHVQDPRRKSSGSSRISLRCPFPLAPPCGLEGRCSDFVTNANQIQQISRAANGVGLAGFFEPYIFPGFTDGSDHLNVWFRLFRQHLSHAEKSKNVILRGYDHVH